MAENTDLVKPRVHDDHIRDLFASLHKELRRIAQNVLNNWPNGQTLQATALVHEVYLRLFAKKEPTLQIESDREFVAYASLAMQSIMVDHARKRGAVRRGGGMARIPLDLVTKFDEVPGEVCDLAEALDRLNEDEPELAELVRMRFFGGLTLAEAGAALGMSRPTADRRWAYARAWLFRELR